MNQTLLMAPWACLQAGISKICQRDKLRLQHEEAYALKVASPYMDMLGAHMSAVKRRTNVVDPLTL